MRSARKLQLDLRLSAAKPDAALRWHEGASVLWLGQSLRLTFTKTHAQTCQENGVLFLPLPQDASPRQIQDCAEAWLRSEAMNYLTQCLHDRMEEKNVDAQQGGRANCARLCRPGIPLRGQVSSPPQMAGQHENALPLPRLTLSFTARGHWIALEQTASTQESTAPVLRCYWRLIEQSPEVIDAALTQALWPYYHHQPNQSLFALSH